MYLNVASLTRNILDQPLSNQAIVLSDNVFPANPLWFQTFNIAALESYTLSSIGIVTGLYTTVANSLSSNTIYVTEGTYKEGLQLFWFASQTYVVTQNQLLSFTQDYPGASSYTLMLYYMFDPANCANMTFNNIQVMLSDTTLSGIGLTYLLVSYLQYSVSNNSLSVLYNLNSTLYL